MQSETRHQVNIKVSFRDLFSKHMVYCRLGLCRTAGLVVVSVFAKLVVLETRNWKMQSRNHRLNILPTMMSLLPFDAACRLRI